MAGISVTFEGTDKLKKLFAAAGPQALPVLEQALVSVANEVLNESKRIVPVDTGVLKNSGQVEALKRSGQGIEVSVGYGGAASQYAEIVHENLAAKHGPGKSAKYLEIPFMAMAPRFVRRVQATFVAYMKGQA